MLDFTRPYYYTPAQMAARADLGYDSVDDLAGKTVCVGAGTTYLDWFGGDARPGVEDDPARSARRLRRHGPRHRPPVRRILGLPGARTSRAGCRPMTTVLDAIADGLPLVALGGPIFAEPLAVAFDITIEDNDSLVAAVDAIVGEMHADGTLTALSTKWFGHRPDQGHRG